jgi:hypothetical protein
MGRLRPDRDEAHHNVTTSDMAHADQGRDLTDPTYDLRQM